MILHFVDRKGRKSFVQAGMNMVDKIHLFLKFHRQYWKEMR